MSYFSVPYRIGKWREANETAVVFDQQSDTVWMNQYYNCGDGVVTVGAYKGDTKNVVGAC